MEVPLNDAPGKQPVLMGRRRSSSHSAAPPSGGSLFSSTSLSASTRGKGPLGSSTMARKRTSMILPSASMGDLVGESSGGGGGSGGAGGAREGPLKDVVAFVDVRTAEGDDAGPVFVDMLKGLGARVLARPTFPMTHIVFKGGKPGTIEKWCAHPDPKPWIVGIGWIVRCREIAARAAENNYVVEITKEAVPDAGKRRRSMEPKALAMVNAGFSVHEGLGNSIGPGAGRKVPTVVTSIEHARRKSLQFAPKVGSPLAKKVFDATALLNDTSSDE